MFCGAAESTTKSLLGSHTKAACHYFSQEIFCSWQKTLQEREFLDVAPKCQPCRFTELLHHTSIQLAIVRLNVSVADGQCFHIHPIILIHL